MHFPKRLQYAAGLLLLSSLALADPPAGTVEITSITWASSVEDDCERSPRVARLSEDQKTISFHVDGMNADVQSKPRTTCTAVIYLHYPDGYKYKLEGARHNGRVDLDGGVEVAMEVRYEIYRTGLEPLVMERSFVGETEGTGASFWLEHSIGDVDITPPLCGAPTEPIQMTTIMEMSSDDPEAQGTLSMSTDNGEDIFHEIHLSWQEC